MKLSKEELFILTALGNQDCNGYEIVKFIQKKFNRIIPLITVYSILEIFQEKDLVGGLFKQDKRKRDRKYYYITSRGEKVLKNNTIN